MLKVARRRFLTSADVKLADFYEKAILNGLLGNQNRDLDGGSGPTSYIYMQVRSHTVDDSDFTVFSVLYHSTRLVFFKECMNLPTRVPRVLAETWHRHSHYGNFTCTLFSS